LIRDRDSAQGFVITARRTEEEGESAGKKGEKPRRRTKAKKERRIKKTTKVHQDARRKRRSLVHALSV
jgi:hypothetical protein